MTTFKPHPSPPFPPSRRNDHSLSLCCILLGLYLERSSSLSAVSSPRSLCGLGLRFGYGCEYVRASGFGVLVGVGGWSKEKGGRFEGRCVRGWWLVDRKEIAGTAEYSVNGRGPAVSTDHRACWYSPVCQGLDARAPGLGSRIGIFRAAGFWCAGQPCRRACMRAIRFVGACSDGCLRYDRR